MNYLIQTVQNVVGSSNYSIQENADQQSATVSVNAGSQASANTLAQAVQSAGFMIRGIAVQNSQNSQNSQHARQGAYQQANGQGAGTYIGGQAAGAASSALSASARQGRYR
jgi:hypothetical protein